MPELHHMYNPAINAFSKWKDPFYSVPFPSSPVVFTQCTTHWRNHWSHIVFVCTFLISVWFSDCRLCLQWAALDRFLCFIWKTATKFQRTWVKCCHKCHLASVLGKVTLSFALCSRNMTLSGFKDSVMELIHFVGRLASVGLQLEGCHCLLLSFVLDFYETVKKRSWS